MVSRQPVPQTTDIAPSDVRSTHFSVGLSAGFSFRFLLVGTSDRSRPGAKSFAACLSCRKVRRFNKFLFSLSRSAFTMWHRKIRSADCGCVVVGIRDVRSHAPSSHFRLTSRTPGLAEGLHPVLPPFAIVNVGTTCLIQDGLLNDTQTGQEAANKEQEGDSRDSVRSS